jgi:hypothetical protein
MNLQSRLPRASSYKAGQNDKKIFAEKGLKDKLKSLGKWGIGDGGYSGHPEELSIPNPHDSKEVARFKSRALKRHERFTMATLRPSTALVAASAMAPNNSKTASKLFASSVNTRWKTASMCTTSS